MERKAEPEPTGTAPPAPPASVAPSKLNGDPCSGGETKKK
jgi:hypothetical protein